jgi:HEAT repeat protein
MRKTQILMILAITFTMLGCGDSGQSVQPAATTVQSASQTISPTEPPIPDLEIVTREDALRALEHDDIRIRWKAVRVLRDFPETAFEDLKKAIQSPHEDVASAAAGAISTVAEPEKVLPVLIETLDHQFSTVRTEAVIGLGRLGPEASSAVPIIEEKMADADARFLEKARETIQNITAQ